MKYLFAFSGIWPQERAIFRAVSTLSPVSTQTFIPACRNASSVSLTLSWSASSTAVAPSNSKSEKVKRFCRWTLKIDAIQRTVLEFGLNFSDSYVTVSQRISCGCYFCERKRLPTNFLGEISTLLPLSKSVYSSTDIFFLATANVRKPTLAKSLMCVCVCAINVRDDFWHSGKT